MHVDRTPRLRTHPTGRRLRTSAIASALALCVAPPMQCLAGGPLAELPQYQSKNDGWRTGLITNDGVIWDGEFAESVRKGRAAAKTAILGEWELLVRGNFTQCYAGGLLHELEVVAGAADGPLKNWAASASTRYFEPASAKQQGADDTEWYSRYAQAWSVTAKAGAAAPKTVHDITLDAYVRLRDGGVDVEKHPSIEVENPQHHTNVAADTLKAVPAARRLAILFAGDPEQRHRNNLTAMRAVLKDQYDLSDENIWILYGDVAAGGAVAGAPWTSSGPASKANLVKALEDATGFLRTRLHAIKGEAATLDADVLLFLWTTDHGTLDAPITIGVSPPSLGQAGSGVDQVILAGDAPSAFVYEANDGSNTAIIGPFEDALGAQITIDSFSGGYDAVRGEIGMYFSVAPNSNGLAPESGVARSVAKGREPASEVFTMVAGSNREAFFGDTLGLVGAAGGDDVTALSLIPASMLTGDDGMGAPILTHSIFFTEDLAPTIWVIDESHPLEPGKVYAFLDPTAADVWPKKDGCNAPPTPPDRIDGLSLYVDMRTDFRKPFDPRVRPESQPPDAGDLTFKAGIDMMVFSVPNGDPFDAIGCNIWRTDLVTMKRIFSCADLGLDADDDVNALHTFSGAHPYRFRNDPEFQNDPITEPPLPSAVCVADLNCDGSVDANDLGLLLLGFGGTGELGDLNDDGIVDGVDIGILLSNWGPCPE